jgi:phospholipid transport system substrate-binding protein
MITYALVAMLLSGAALLPGAASDGATRRIAGSSAAGVPSPTATLRTSSEALRKTLARRYPSWSPQAEAQESAVEAVIDRIMDFGEIARRSLGPQWERISPEDRQEFVRLLQRIIERSPLDRSLNFDPDSSIRFEREHIDDAEALVSSVVTTAARRGPTRHPVEYRLCLKGGRWRIYDIIVNDVSLVEGYRAQFVKIIAHDSFDGLLRRMRKKLGQMPAEPS